MPGGELSAGEVRAPSGATAPAPTWVGPGTSIATPCDPAPTAVAPLAPPGACRLPCETGNSMWHLRGLGGFVTFSGTDPADDCGYAGLDFGRTFCGCWGLDVFYRWNSGQFDRLTPTGLSTKARLVAEFLRRKQAEYDALKAEIEELRSELRRDSTPRRNG